MQQRRVGSGRRERREASGRTARRRDQPQGGDPRGRRPDEKFAYPRHDPRPRPRGHGRVHRRRQAVRAQHRARRPQPRHPRRDDHDDPRPLGDRASRCASSTWSACCTRTRATCWCTGRSVPDMTDDELFDMRKKFGVLFQDGALFGSMNLYDNVAFPLRQHTEKARGRDPRDRLPPPEGGRPRRRRGEDAERALRRHAQARRLRPRAGARSRDRAVRRARLRPRPGAHRAPVRPHQGGPRRRTAAPTS